MMTVLVLIINCASCKTNKSDRIYGEPQYILEVREEISNIGNSIIDSTKYFYLNSNLIKKIHYVLPNVIQLSEYDSLGSVILVQNCFKVTDCSEIRYCYNKNIKVKSEYFSDGSLDYNVLYTYDKRNKIKHLYYYYPDSTLYREEIYKNDEMPIVKKEYYKDTAIVRAEKTYNFIENKIIEKIYARSGEIIHIDSTTNLISRDLLLKYSPKFSKIMNKSKMIKDLTLDDKGNWILREIYELDKLKYRITREIKY